MQIEIIEALCMATDSSDALYMLYRWKKHVDPKNSLAFFCRAAGITSTGYLSDVLNRKRTLHPKYRRKIVKAFALEREAARCLKTLIDIDNTKSAIELRRLRARLSLYRKALKVTRPEMAPGLGGFLFALEVFCAAGLFANSPRREDLLEYFGNGRKGDIDRALVMLAELKLMKESGDRWQPTSTQIVFGAGAGTPTQLEFLRLALAHAGGEVEKWFPRKESAYFGSYIISVDSEGYKKLLPQLKSRVNMMHAELDSTQANMLVRFNVQLYPLGDKAEAVLLASPEAKKAG